MPDAPYPPGGTFFDTVRKSFADVPIQRDADNAIPTSDFLEAAESLTKLFDVLGSAAFTPVKSDMTGNIKPDNKRPAQKVRDRQLAAPGDSATLQSLVVNELKTKKHTATEGLLWLVRGLDLTAQHAYGNTLKPHHSMFVKPIFSAAMSATPYRKDFYAKLGDDQAVVNAKLDAWLKALEEQVAILKAFQATSAAKW